MVDKSKDGLSIAKLESRRDVLSCFDWVSRCTVTQQGDLMDRQNQRISPEAEAGAWLRDEPTDIGSSGCFHPSVAVVGRDCDGSLCNEVKMEIGGSEGLSEGSWSSGCASDLSKDAAAQRQGSSSRANLFAQLRATKIKESVILEAIQRYGGGQKGLRGVIKAIMFWLQAKNRVTFQSSDSCTSTLEPLSPLGEGTDQLPWSNAEPGSAIDVQFGAFGNFNLALPADLSCLRNSTASCRDDGGSFCDLRMGGSVGGQYSELSNHENQSYVGTGEPGTVGLRSQGSGTQRGNSPLLSSNWVPPMRDYILPHENVNRARMSRKLSSSPDRGGLQATQDLTAAYHDNHSHRDKIRRHSAPVGFTFPESSSELLVYGSAASPSVSEIPGTAGIFSAVGANPCAPGGPFSLSSSSSGPMDLHSPDFTSFGMQGSVLINDNLGMGSSAHGCVLTDGLGSLGYPVSPDDSVDRNDSGIIAKSKVTPAACTRLARKNRMNRNRKAAIFQANRGGAETGALLASKTGGMWSSGALRTMPRSLRSPASEGLAARLTKCKIKDRRHQEHLQFLLQKVLRPSDVGNLGRIVLPKKDAESHLPWLGAREGIQFPCEDYDTGEKLMLRYRFWPNNKSRMYLLENTGDFVKKHKLEESDRMLIYRNQQEGSYIIRARKARDCVGGYQINGPCEEMVVEGKEISEQNSSEATCSSGTSSSDKDVETPDSNVCSHLEGATVYVGHGLGVVTSQDDLLNFADLPDAPMGEGTENLVRFPSLESFDVELLELGSVAADKQNSRMSALISHKI